MSAVAERTPYDVARRHAERLALALEPGCERIDIAGSLRRGLDSIGDIELVALPKVATSDVDDGLWGEKVAVQHNALDAKIDELLMDGVLASHPVKPTRGDRYGKFLHVPSGMQVDLFQVLPPAQFGVILLIRTGPAGYSQAIVTLARKRGFHVAHGALHESSMIREGCPDVCTIYPTDSEREVYAALRLPFINPQDR